MTPETTTKATRKGTWTLIVLILIAAAFLGGWIPEWLAARRAAQEAASARVGVAQLESQRDLARLEGKLGLVMYEANRNNFADASTRATDFFNGLTAALQKPAAAAVSKEAELRSILARRDDIGADLARADQAVKQKLADMYVQYDAALQ